MKIFARIRKKNADPKPCICLQTSIKRYNKVILIQCCDLFVCVCPIRQLAVLIPGLRVGWYSVKFRVFQRIFCILPPLLLENKIANGRFIVVCKHHEDIHILYPQARKDNATIQTIKLKMQQPPPPGLGLFMQAWTPIPGRVVEA